jgi:hypothetical protein
MNPWIINPSWQNYSSMIREATAACDARTGFERAHHLTAALYFGIASLEAFINQKTRAFLEPTHDAKAIYDVIRGGSLRAKGKDQTLLSKLKHWPAVLTGKSPVLQTETWDRIAQFNGLRGDLTHIKTTGHDVYSLLDTIAPDTVIDAVAEYIAQYHASAGTRFPYWLWGWNYLNPQVNGYEIMPVNAQQFVFSMQAMGYDVPAAMVEHNEGWQRMYMSDMTGYASVAAVLRTMDQCQQRHPRFPLQPVLCRRWWLPEHQSACGAHGPFEAAE